MNKYVVIKKIDEYLSVKDYVKARKLIRNDLKRFGTKDEYYMYLGLASIEPEERAKYYEKAVDANPKNLDAVINLGNALDELGDYDEALEYYNKALEINPKDSSAYSMRACAKLDLGDFNGANADLEVANKLYENLQTKGDS